MRKPILLLTAIATAAVGVAAMAQVDPRERFNRMRPQQPAQQQRPVASGPIADQGVHNAVHAAHQNQIVFTRIDTSIGAITEGDVASDFTLGQPMFFRVFTERSAVRPANCPRAFKNCCPVCVTPTIPVC